MIKDCRVILNNEAVTVVRYDDIDIQFPSIHKESKYVRVLFQDGKYRIVDADYQETATTTVKDNKNKPRNKKTTIEENETETPAEETSLDIY